MIKKKDEYLAEKVSHDIGLESFTINQVFNGRCISGEGRDKNSGLLKQCIALYDENGIIKYLSCVDKKK